MAEFDGFGVETSIVSAFESALIFSVEYAFSPLDRAASVCGPITPSGERPAFD